MNLFQKSLLHIDFANLFSKSILQIGLANPRFETRFEEVGTDAPAAEPDVKTKVLKTPPVVSDEVRKLHLDHGHVPQRTWCSHCVDSMLKEDPHSLTEFPEGATPEVQMDYTKAKSADDGPDDELILLDA